MIPIQLSIVWVYFQLNWYEWMGDWTYCQSNYIFNWIIPDTYKRITKWMNGRITNNSIINWIGVFPNELRWMNGRMNVLPIELSFQLNDTVYVWTYKRMNEWMYYQSNYQLYWCITNWILDWTSEWMNGQITNSIIDWMSGLPIRFLI